MICFDKKHLKTIYNSNIPRLYSTPDGSAEAMELRKMAMNHSREYWYMGSMLDRSVVQKNRSCVRVATGMYLLRVLSISSSVASASATLA